MTGAEEDVDDSDPPEAEGRPRVRGTLSRLVKKGKKEIPVSEDPDTLLWQVQQFTDRVVKKHGTDSLQAARARMELSLQLGTMGRWEEARQLREESFTSFSRHAGEQDAETLHTELSLVIAQAHTDRWTEAEAHLRHAAATSLEALGPDHEVTALAQRRLDEFAGGGRGPASA